MIKNNSWGPAVQCQLRAFEPRQSKVGNVADNGHSEKSFSTALTFEFTGMRGFLRRSGGMMGSALLPHAK